LAGAGAAGKYRDPKFASDLNRRGDIPFVPRNERTDRFDLINRGIRGITASRFRIEQNLAFSLAFQLVGERFADIRGRIIARLWFGVEIHAENLKPPNFVCNPRLFSYLAVITGLRCDL
jgi:hypothetical protein